MRTFPDFGRELQRPFEVHEDCYDCAEFYYDCKGWRGSMDFACRDFNRLPDVLPGTCGQIFPPSRMRGRKEPRVCPKTTSSKTSPQPQRRDPEKWRKYMRGYMQRRRAALPKSQSVSGVPVRGREPPVFGPGIENVNHTRPAGVGGLSVRRKFTPAPESCIRKSMCEKWLF